MSKKTYTKFGRWLCRKMDWHRRPQSVEHGFNGGGNCPRCGHRVLRDSQGNWFSVAQPLTR